MAVRTTFLERYLAGEHEQVWDELMALGAIVREEPPYADALAVARETMRRVRHNIEILIPRLQNIRYAFGYEWEQAEARQDAAEVEAYRIERTNELLAEGMSPDDPFFDDFNRMLPTIPDPSPDPIFAPPSPDVASHLAALERLRGDMPVSVQAWYEVVGSVNFTGLAPTSWWEWQRESLEDDSLPSTSGMGVRPTTAVNNLEEHDWLLLDLKERTCFLDPIYLWPIEQAIRVAEADEAMLQGEEGELPWVPHPSDEDPTGWTVDPIRPSDVRRYVAMGPDIWGKYDFSGSGPAGVGVPDASMDGLFANDSYRARFVDYLRLCFCWGGLPGLRDLTRWTDEHKLLAHVDRIDRDTRYLTEGLLRF